MALICRPGKGALVRHGLFWYPARLLQLEETTSQRLWRVRDWRLNVWSTEQPDPNRLVLESDIVDELWGQRHERRMIRVSVSLTVFENQTRKLIC